MKALLLSDYGGFDNLALHDVPTPQPAANEVLVRLRAAGLNPLDNTLRSGNMRTMMPLAFPYIPGFDGAGVIEQVGAGVSAFKPGDAVIGMFPIPGNGTLAEYVLHRNYGPLVAKPEGLSFEKAAALPEAGMTALSAFDATQVTAGQTFLIIGATGGIGMYLIQLAVQQGARVIATAKPQDNDYMRRLGAADIIDYSAGDAIAAVQQRYPNGIDVVVDLVNQMERLYHSATALRVGGTLVSTLFGPDPSTFTAKPMTVSYVRLEPNVERLTSLAQDAASGKLRIEIGKTFALGQAVEALLALEQEHILGKIVVTIP